MEETKKGFTDCTCNGWEAVLRIPFAKTDVEEASETETPESQDEASSPRVVHIVEAEENKEENDDEPTQEPRKSHPFDFIENADWKKLIALVEAIPETASSALSGRTSLFAPKSPEDESLLADEDDEEASPAVEENPEDAESRALKEAVENVSVTDSDVDKPFDFIEGSEWAKLIALIKAFPRTASATPPTIPSDESDECQGTNSVLHEACKKQPPLEVVAQILEAKEDLAKRKGEHGYLPLHVACDSGASAKVVGKLLEFHPEGIRHFTTVERMLPLHLACKSGASKDVLMLLLPMYPEATLIRDSSDKTPMDYAEGSPAASCLELGPSLCSASKAARMRCEQVADLTLKGIQDAHVKYVEELKENNGEVLSKLADIIRENRARDKQIEETYEAQELKIKELEEKLKMVEQSSVQQVSKLEQEKSEKDEALKSKEKVLTEKEAECQQLRETITTKAAEVDAAENQLKLHEQAYSCLLDKEQTDLKRVEEENVELKLKVEAQSKELSSLKSNHETMLSSLTAKHESEFNQAIKEIQELTTRVTKHETKLASLRDIVNGGEETPTAAVMTTPQAVTPGAVEESEDREDVPAQWLDHLSSKEEPQVSDPIVDHHDLPESPSSAADSTEAVAIKKSGMGGPENTSSRSRPAVVTCFSKKGSDCVE